MICNISCMIELSKTYFNLKLKNVDFNTIYFPNTSNFKTEMISNKYQTILCSLSGIQRKGKAYKLKVITF